jgi:transposase
VRIRPCWKDQLPCRKHFLPSSALTSSPWPARARRPLRQIAKDVGVSEACLHRWLKIADRDDGVDRTGSPVARDESAELREARKRIKLLEQEAEVMRRAVGYLIRDVNPK